VLFSFNRTKEISVKMATIDNGARDKYATDTAAIEIADIAQQDSLLNPTIDAIPELYPETPALRQPSRWKQVVHQLTKRKVKAFIYNYRWLLFFIFGGIVASSIMFAYRREFFQALEALSHKLSGLGSR
jgi:hypothetical protein